eukprot:1108043-Prymnesium_polylepis.1
MWPQRRARPRAFCRAPRVCIIRRLPRPACYQRCCVVRVRGRARTGRRYAFAAAAPPVMAFCCCVRVLARRLRTMRAAARWVCVCVACLHDVGASRWLVSGLAKV